MHHGRRAVSIVSDEVASSGRASDPRAPAQIASYCVFIWNFVKVTVADTLRYGNLTISREYIVRPVIQVSRLGYY